MGKLPIVAIVGRPNVGKSALFNRLARRRIAIVHDQPGVTRDRLTADCAIDSFRFTLIDTGGIGSAINDSFTEQVRTEADLAMEMAHLILFVTDGRDGLTPVDELLARELRRAKKPIIVVVNKIDHPKQEDDEAEFSRLGFPEVLPISAAHGRGISELSERITAYLPEKSEEPTTASRPLKLAIVGRPNVGKSSLINAVLHDRRTIVSSVAGTTRDAIDIPYEREGKPFVLIDTAGIRARGKQSSSVEVFSVMRSQKSIERADICTLVVDAVDGVTAQDKKIADLIQQNEKPCLVVVNKLDLVKPLTGLRTFFDGMLDRIRSDLFFINYAPIDLLSAQTGENLSRLFQSIARIEKHSRRTLGTGPLNRLLQLALETHPPPARGNRRLKILYATQLDNPRSETIQPPAFLLFVNDPRTLTDDYRRYLEGKIREQLGYYGLPVLFRLRGRVPRRGER
jgi:GTP-binding protein